MSNTHTLTFTAGPAHIDANGHVNNAVWVQWMEDLATAHWLADARPRDVQVFGWVVTRHEIDYRSNIRAGESVTATTEIREPPRGARFERHIMFSDTAGRPLVTARTSWAMVDRRTGRLARVPAEVAAPFLPNS